VCGKSPKERLIKGLRDTERFKVDCSSVSWTITRDDFAEPSKERLVLPA